MKLDEIEALARDGETDAASILALIAVVRAAKHMRKWTPQGYTEEYDVALAKLESI